jgi:hypothetical protein
VRVDRHPRVDPDKRIRAAGIVDAHLRAMLKGKPRRGPATAAGPEDHD